MNAFIPEHEKAFELLLDYAGSSALLEEALQVAVEKGSGRASTEEIIEAIRSLREKAESVVAPAVAARSAGA